MSKKRFVLFLIGLLLLMTGCIEEAGFVPAPPPMEVEYVMAIQQIKVGDAQIMSVTSPDMQVEFRQNGSGAGETRTEVVTLADGSKGTMVFTTWGAWDNSELELVVYYGPNGEVTSALVTASFSELNLLQIATGSGVQGARMFERSEVIFQYLPTEEGFKLKNVQYVESYGVRRNLVNYGGYAVWSGNLDFVPSNMHSWGFWENEGSPAVVVREALAAVVLNAPAPNYQVIDSDGAGEVIGRQTGLSISQGNTNMGEIAFTYGNTFGRMPNTNLIGSGALSMVEWKLGEDPNSYKDYYMVVLSPRISPVGNSVVVFVDDPTTAGSLLNDSYVQRPSKLYQQLREGTIPGVFLALHGQGDIGAVSESSGDSVTHVGDEGGVRWSVIGSVEHEDVLTAYDLFAMLGQSQEHLGLYYAYQPGSGSSLNYYLAALVLNTAPEDRVLKEVRYDVGVLDRTTFPTSLQIESLR